MDQSRQPRADGSRCRDLADACAELHNLILDRPDVADFLHQLAVLAAAVVAGSHCGVTLRRDRQVASVAGSDEIAMRMDEIQYMRAQGPCLQAMQDGARVDVPEMAVETRWGDYASRARANGVQSSISLPLTLNGVTMGAVNLFSAYPRAFAETDVERAQAFTAQAATALTLLLRHADAMTLDAELREALATRAVIDQALGILMGTGRITAGEAFAQLRHESQTNNRKLSDIAAELIETTTGRPPEPPRPLTRRG